MGKISRYDKNKWITLITFAVMYNFVYVGRFNVVELLPQIAQTLGISNYHQELISGGVFFSYAIGSVISGWLSDRYGGKRMIIIGGAVSIFANMTVIMSGTWIMVMMLQIINGFFQSMIWVGGISVLAQWWAPGTRGKGVGISNFFSGLSHITAYMLPMVFLKLMPEISWKGEIVFPMYVWGLFLIIFCMFATERPEDKGLDPYKVFNSDMESEKRIEKSTGSSRKIYEFFKSDKSFYVWCMLALLSSICRYGLLNWISAYFQAATGEPFLDQTFLNTVLPIGMALGTLIITWLGGSKFNKNKGLVIVWAAALCGTLIIIFPIVGMSRPIFMGIFFTGFFLYGINGMLWLYAIDAGGRRFSGTIAGFLNGFAYLGATLESFIFPAVIDITGNILYVFIVMEVLCIAMIICGILISKKNTVVEPEVRE